MKVDFLRGNLKPLSLSCVHLGTDRKLVKHPMKSSSKWKLSTLRSQFSLISADKRIVRLIQLIEIDWTTYLTQSRLQLVAKG
jgi:hypothetical protein